MRPSSTLSSSALNYLESLERNSKALRGNNVAPIKKDEKKPGTAPASGKRKESISDIINHARRQTSLARTDSDDFDVLNESLKSSLFDGSVSTDTDSEESTARILPPGTPGQQVGRKSLKEIRELRNSIDQSLVKTPESKMSRTKTEDLKKKTHFESIKEEIAEDIPKTPIPSKSPFKKAIQSGSESSDAESIVFDELFEEVLPSPPREPTSAPVSKKVAEVATKSAPPQPKMVKKKAKTPTPTSSESEDSESSESESSSESETSTVTETKSESRSLSSSSSSSSSSSESEPDSKSSKSSDILKTSPKATEAPNPYDDDFESEKSSSSTVKVEKPQEPKPKVKPEKVKEPVHVEPISPIPYEDFIPKPSSDAEESSKSTVIEDKVKKTVEKESKKEDKKEERKKVEKKGKIDDRKKRSSSSSAYSSSLSSSSSSVEQEGERARDRGRRRKSRGGRSQRRNEVDTCQHNIHNVIESVVRTHVQMLDEFNRMEYTAVSQWTATFKRFENDDSPNSRKLKEIIQGRLNRNFSL